MHSFDFTKTKEEMAIENEIENLENHKAFMQLPFYSSLVVLIASVILIENRFLIKLSVETKAFILSFCFSIIFGSILYFYNNKIKKLKIKKDK